MVSLLNLTRSHSKTEGFCELQSSWEQDKNSITCYPVVNGVRDLELGVPIFPINDLFNGEPSSYLEFPNHLITWIEKEAYVTH